MFAVVLVACSDNAEETEENNDTETEEEAAEEGSEESAEEQATPQPDLEDVPDVVAEVNGEEITKEEFTEVYEIQFDRAVQQGQITMDSDQENFKTQLAESLIAQELIKQAVNDSEVSVSDEELEETFKELAQSNGLETKEDFLTAVEGQGMTEEEATEQVKLQVKVDKFVAEEAGDLEPTEEELVETYEELKKEHEESENEQELPGYEEAKTIIADQLRKENEARAYQNLVETLREEADVTINL